MFNRSNVLVAGGTGLIGQPLVHLLLNAGANVRVASLEENPLHFPPVDYLHCDLMIQDDCNRATKDMDFVFHLASPKGSAVSAASRPAFFYVSNILINTHLLEAAHNNKVQRFLYASTMHVYSKDGKDRDDNGVITFFENDANVENNWGGAPYVKEHVSGLWAKRMGELHVKACAEEYGWDKIAIVRPTTVYGPNDNFDPKSSFLIPDIIRKCACNKEQIVLKNKNYGRDFIYCDDVAGAMMAVMEQFCNCQPVNIGWGKVHSVIDILECICDIFGISPSVSWESCCDDKSLLDISTLTDKCLFKPSVSLYNGLEKTVQWFNLHCLGN